jgi:hypothetical protein
VNRVEDLITGILIWMIILLNGVIYVRERMLRDTEVVQHAQSLLNKLRKYKFNYTEVGWLYR